MRRSLIVVVFAFLSLFAEGQGIISYKKPDPSVPSVRSHAEKVRNGHRSNVQRRTGTDYRGRYRVLSRARRPKAAKERILRLLGYKPTCDRMLGCSKSPTRGDGTFASSEYQRWVFEKVPGDVHTWLFPNDDSVDLAVMSVVMPDDADTAAIPVELFATKEFMHNEVIAEGTPIILSGYFYQFPGERKFQAIVRQGILSMVPDEPITTTSGKLGTVYLGDVHIFGGNSGSPVMVEAGLLNTDGYHLLGVVSGYYYEDQHFNLQVATTVKATGQANSGIAMIVPVDFLKTLLDAP